MRIEVRIQEDVAIMALSGKFLAGGDGPYLRQKIKDLVEAGVRKLVVNFSGVPYIDSTGLGFLAGSRVTVQSSGATMMLSNVNEHVRKILDSVRLSEFFDIAEDESDALGKLKEAGRRLPDPQRNAAKGSRKKRPAASAE